MIPKNAITMVGKIDRCFLFTFRVDPLRVASLVPPPLELKLFHGFAYFNVVVSHLSQMRPLGVPAMLGMSYHHVAYRLYAQYGDDEGLFFLRSDADSPLIVGAGSLLTSFQFHHAMVNIGDEELSCDALGARLRVGLPSRAPILFPGSPFVNLAEAAEALKYKPAGLSANDREVDILRITRDESAWRARVIPFEVRDLEFLNPYDPIPEIGYEVEPIQYRWNRAERFPIQT